MSERQGYLNFSEFLWEVCTQVILSLILHIRYTPFSSKCENYRSKAWFSKSYMLWNIWDPINIAVLLHLILRVWILFQIWLSLEYIKVVLRKNFPCCHIHKISISNGKNQPWLLLCLADNIRLPILPGFPSGKAAVLRID